MLVELVLLQLNPTWLVAPELLTKLLDFGLRVVQAIFLVCVYQQVGNWVVLRI